MSVRRTAWLGREGSNHQMAKCVNSPPGHLETLQGDAGLWCSTLPVNNLSGLDLAAVSRYHPSTLPPSWQLAAFDGFSLRTPPPVVRDADPKR
jgi:hypothetical protein